jgi:tRNA1Val (adenine37-N6)-methyltransferase
MGGDDALSCDGFLDGRLRIWQPRVGYRAAVDPVLLAAFVPAVAGQRVLDLGCGVGTAGLCLGWRVPGLELHGLEVQPDYAALARRNAQENRIAFTVHGGDLLRPPAALRALSFDHVLMNPPYHPANSPATRDAGRDTAHREGEARLADWIDAGLRRLVPGGRMAMIHAPGRLAEMLAALGGRAGAIEIVPVAPRAGSPASRVLVAARKGRGADLQLLPAFTLHEIMPDSTEAVRYTRDGLRVLRNGESIVGQLGRE